MATNGKPGKSRKGMVKSRSQFLNPLIDRFVKRDADGEDCRGEGRQEDV